MSRLPFVGRGRELAVLRASATASGLCLVGGEPGIGKTRLIETFCDTLADERYVWARSWDFGGAPPFWLFIQVARQLASTLDDVALARVAGDGARALARLVAELADRLCAPDAIEDPAQAKFEAIQAFAGFLVRYASIRPLVVVLDDLHGADEASLELLRFIARTPHSHVALIATYRTVDSPASPDVANRIAELARDASVIELRGLAEVDVSELLRRVGVSDDEAAVRARALVNATAGNPLLVDGALRAESGALASDVGAAIEGRIARLSDAARSTLAAAAVLGRPATIALLHQVCGGALSDMLDALDACVRGGLLVEDGDRYTFFHPVVRELTYSRMGIPLRARLHASAYQALDRLYGLTRVDHLGELARHALAAYGANLVERGVADSLEASARALLVGGLDQAVTHAEQALQHAPAPGWQVRALEACGDARLAAGRTPGARDAFASLMQCSRGSDSMTFGRAAIGFARTFEFGITEPRRIAALEEARSMLGDSDSAIAARVLGRLAMDRWSDAAAYEQRCELTDRALAMARRLDDADVLCDVLAARLLAVWGPRHLAERLAFTAELEQLASRTNRRDRLIEAYRFRINALVEAGELVGAEAAIKGYGELARALGRPQLIANAWMREFLPPMARKEYERALSIARTCRDAMRVAGDPQADVVYVARRVMIASECDDVETLREHVPALQRHVEARSAFVLYRAILLRGLVAAEQLDAARAQADRCFAQELRDVGNDMMTPSTLVLLVPPIIRLGDHARVELLNARLQPYRELYAAIGASYPLGPVADHLAACERALGLSPQVKSRPSIRRTGVFQRRGAQWNVGFDGTTSWVPHARGMIYLARLLEHPGSDLLALELAGLDATERAMVSGGEDEVIDARALAAYRERASELREEIERAEANHDLGRLDAARTELDVLAERIAGDSGLGSRRRRASGAAERARTAVTKAISRAIAAIRESQPEVAQHLDRAVRTGATCRYAPDLAARVDWRVEVTS